MKAQTRHTPGPWEYFKVAEISTYEIFKRTSVDTHIAIGKAFVGKEAEANARLMSAAPELLAACKEVFEYFRAANLHKIDQAEMLRKAIEKAEAGE